MKKYNPWIFALGTLLILVQFYTIKDHILAAVLTGIGVLCSIYAIYTNQSMQKSKYIIIGLYIILLVIYVICNFL